MCASRIYHACFLFAAVFDLIVMDAMNCLNFIVMWINNRLVDVDFADDIACSANYAGDPARDD